MRQGARTPLEVSEVDRAGLCERQVRLQRGSVVVELMRERSAVEQWKKNENQGNVEVRWCGREYSEALVKVRVRGV